ncbi:MAG: hypothetical protein ACI9R3_002909 [Verrucomicrobiales bacterium]|jgi:hypothetical protein
MIDSLRMKIISLIVALFLAPHHSFSAVYTLSHQRGFYDEPFDLTVATDLEEGAVIRFTTDGSSPSRGHGEVYASSLKIVTTSTIRLFAYAGEEEIATTHTFLFAGHVADQEAQPEGYVNAIESGRNGSARPHTFDWAMDPEVLEDTTNNGNLVEHLLSIPSLALTMDVEDLNYIYTNHTRRGVDYERAASVELIYPKLEGYARFKGFQIVSGIRMQGGGAVDQARKKSFRLLFKEEYGFPKLEYPLFESAVHHADSAARRFDNVVLRAAGNTNWSKDDAWKHEPSTYLRDPFVRDSQVAISGFGARSTFVHLYINGYYFGLYNIAERPDDKFMAEYFGGDREDYYSINHGGTVEGSSSEWNRLTRSSSLRDLDEDLRYADFIERFDVAGYCDYVLLNWSVGMGDWPWNNFYGGIRNEPDGRARFFSWDSEYAFWTIDGYLGSNPTGWVHPRFASDGGVISEFWRALEVNDDFLMTFADRVYKHCYNDGPLSDANMRARFQRLADHIEGAIVAESARWGDSAWGKEEEPHTRKDDWAPNVKDVLDLMDGNLVIFVEELRQAGYYPDTLPPQLPELLSYPVSTGFAFKLENLNVTGTLHYTVDGSDPRDPSAATYASGEEIVVESEMNFRARARTNGEWSPLAEQLITMEGIGIPLRITELMYHPAGGNEALEFIELQNIGTVPLDVSGHYFRGIDYRFPPDTNIAPLEIVILIPNDDPEAFAVIYPATSVFGTYRGHFDNGGETISLMTPFEETVTELSYDDADQWESAADGGGRSLVRVNLRSNDSEPTNWVKSPAEGGSPGVVTPVEIDANRDSDSDGYTDLQEAIAGTDPNNSSSYPLLDPTIDLVSRTVTLSFNAFAGRRYMVESAPAPNGPWAALETKGAMEADRSESVMDPTAVEGSQRYYRLVIDNL